MGQRLRNISIPYFVIYATIFIVTISTGLLIIVDVIGWSNVLNITLPITVGTYAQMVSGVGSLALTLGLVLLYGEQTGIQRRQEEWMEAEHVPDVFVDSWELTENRFMFQLTNLGTGVAKNLSVSFKIDVNGSESVSINRLSGGAPLTQEGLATRVLVKDADLEDSSVKMTGEHDLRIDATQFTNEFTRLESGEKLQNTLDELASEDNLQLEYTIYLEYDYVRRESDCKSVYGGKVDLEPNIDFEGILLATEQGEVSNSDLNVRPDNLKDV